MRLNNNAIPLDSNNAFSTRLQRIAQGTPALIFSGFTVIQLNHYKEHPRRCELSQEKEGVKISYGELLSA